MVDSLEPTLEQTECWIAAALAEANALRQHDADLFPKDTETLAEAVELRAAWLRWVDDAELLRHRVEGLLGASSRRHINGLVDLEYAIGRTRAMLTITPESYLDGLEEIRRGEVIGIEEVRGV